MTRWSDSPRERQESPTRHSDEISLLEAVDWAKGHWRLLTVSALGFALLFCIAALVRPATYTAIGTFLPESNSGGGAPQVTLPQGLAGLFRSVGDQSAFYADLVESQVVLQQVASAEYSDVNADGERSQGSLAQLWGSEMPPAEALLRATDRLKGMVDVVVRGTGLVEVRVTADDRQLAEQIASQFIAAVDAWNREHRQTQNTIERDFIAARLEEAQQELLVAEREQESWLEQNARWQSSPKLQFEFNRLERRVRQRQAVYTLLSTTYEDMSLAAVRNTPSISVVDQPSSGLYPNDRRVLFHVVAGLVVGGVVGLALAIASDLGLLRALKGLRPSGSPAISRGSS